MSPEPLLPAMMPTAPPLAVAVVEPTEPPTDGAGTSGGNAAPQPGPDPQRSGGGGSGDEDPAAVVRQAVEEVTESVVETVDAVVKPRAAAAVATSFSFPLTLTMLVVLFLLIQPRVDRADPKLRSSSDPLVGFEEEEAL
jgi:hypothetical protein